MLDIIIEAPEVENLLKDEKKMGMGLVYGLNRMYPNTIGDGRGSNVWIVSRQTYCNDEWYQRIKSLRIADDNLHHVRFTNSYVEQRLKEYFDELNDMRRTSKIFAEQLNELSKTDTEFTRVVFAYLSRTKTKRGKFRNLARKSKSVEYSIQKCASSVLKERHEMPRSERCMQRKGYGKYCSTCGAIEVPSQNSMVRCRECNCEIILQELCSSCDSLGKQLKIRRISEDETFSSCEYVRRTIRRGGIGQKKLRKGSAVYCRNDQSSYCYDCNFPSRGTTAVAHKENTSADSLIPQSDSDFMRPHSCDHDIPSSISSGSWKPAKMEEGDESLDEQYATPRECFSATEIEISLDEETNSDEYVEAPEPEEPKISKMDFDALHDRLHRAGEALQDITIGNLKLEEEMLTLEEISQQNVSLSATVRDILSGMTERLQENSVIEYGGESSDEFEEAVGDTDTDSFHDIQPPSHCYLCLHCGVKISNRQMNNCSSCERMLAEIPKGFFGREAPLQPTRNELLPAHRISNSWKPHNSIVSAYPALVSGNIPRLRLTSVEDRLRFIESETNLLRDNNEIINLFVDDFKTKLQQELESVQRVYSGKGSFGEMTVFGIDVSFYQFIQHVTERRGSREMLTNEAEEKLCERGKTFMEMKVEEVFKKEQQTAVELEIFEQKLEVEGLIIKEKEDFFTCSNVGEDQPLQTQTIESENFPTAEKSVKNDNLLISIEIELEKTKAIRCEYKANLQKRMGQEEMITLCPTWASNGPALHYSNEVVGEEPFFIDIERDDLVQIKSPKSFSSSSYDDDDDNDEWSEENQLITGSTVAAVVMPLPMHSVTVIRPQETPFALLNVLNAKKEFSRVSQIELSHSPESGVVFLQAEAVSPLDCHHEESFEEFFEAESHTDIAFQQNVSRVEKSLVHFIPINMEVTSIAGISLQNETLPILVTEDAKPVEDSIPDVVPELTTALSLIREIEKDVVEVKLSNAIAILPKLESVLRDHHHDKIKPLKKSSTMSSTNPDIFMSALNLLMEEGGDEAGGEVESEERLGRIINLLTGLEEAVREINSTEDGRAKCEKPDRIHNLLRDLGSRIEAYADASAKNIMQSTSELDVPAMNMETPVGAGDCYITADILKSLKKKIFEVVASEAQERDSRLEQGMGRIAKLEKENMEATGFLTTLLDKTLRRVRELDDVRATATKLGNEIEAFIRKEEKKEKSLPRIAHAPTLPVILEVSSDCSTIGDGDNVKETLSGMIVALENLKMKAKEKTEKYKEIFGNGRGPATPPKSHPDGLGVNCSAPSEMPETGEGVTSRITEFSRIGANTFFMTWTKPTFNGEELPVAGYEIWVNGKVNQRVRNPERLKAILYSCHPRNPGGQLRIRLFALTGDGRRSSLADLRYPEE